jgi:enamine deaminase RidA (YjgF/YER057c/UK114 family)
MDIEANLASLGVVLATAPAPVGNYLPFRMCGNLVYLSGSITLCEGRIQYAGAVGRERSLEEGYAAARLCAVNQLSILKSALGGDLSRVRQVLSLTGFVWAVEGFVDSPKVINGASDLYVAVLGEAGRHSRAAVAVSGLPGGSTVEVQTVFEVF